LTEFILPPPHPSVKERDPRGALSYDQIVPGQKCLVCVECLIGKQKKPILFKVTEPSSIPYRTPPACAKMAAYPDPPPVIPVPDTGVAQVTTSPGRGLLAEQDRDD
jgi:hypothetical protein